MRVEVGKIATAFLPPQVRDAFQFLHPFGLRDGASEPREQMNVVFHASCLATGLATLGFGTKSGWDS